MKKIIIMALLCANWIMAQPAESRPVQGGGEMGRGDLKAMLNLTPEQDTKVKELVQNLQQSMALKKITLERIDLDVQEEMIKDNPDIAKISKILEKKSPVLVEMELESIKKDLEIKKILTSDQWLKWKAMMKMMEQRGGTGMPGKKPGQGR
ncbi:MAG: hypothetical protein A2096_14440 [Spirochaetes bacterium GWF1_41_5]|nr:MAG: hypothetical protein A2096_14440 [Spirochaetes bacterium GWF1_41_5]HBE01799.1 hypothetical protein [Spirochaetia bacterium]